MYKFAAEIQIRSQGSRLLTLSAPHINHNPSKDDKEDSSRLNCHPGIRPEPFRLLFSGGYRGTHSVPARHRRRSRRRTRSQRVLRTDRRTHPLDQFPLRRNAYLPEYPRPTTLPYRCNGHEKCADSPAHLCQPDVYPDAGLLHPAAGIRHTGMAGRLRQHHVGLLVLLLHSDFGGTHLEVSHLCLHPAHNSGHRARLPSTCWQAAYSQPSSSPCKSCPTTCRCPTTSCSSSCSSQHIFEDAWRNKTLPRFFKASAVLLVAALIGVAANLSNLYHTYTYSKETMRGKASWCRPVMPPSKPAADWTVTTSPTGATASAKPGHCSFPTSKAVPPPPPSARAKPPWKRPIRCTEACTIHSAVLRQPRPWTAGPIDRFCSSSCWAALS